LRLSTQPAPGYFESAIAAPGATGRDGSAPQPVIACAKASRANRQGIVFYALFAHFAVNTIAISGDRKGGRPRGADTLALAHSHLN